MNKPFSMLYEEFKIGVTSLINNSSLPPFVIESVLQNCLYEVNAITKNVLQSDKAQYEELLEKEKEEKTNNDIKNKKD